MLALALGLALSPLSLADDFTDGAWMRFSRGPGPRGDGVLVEIVSPVNGGPTDSFVLRRQRIGQDGKRIDWAVGRTCPAVETIIEAVNRLPMPKLAPYGIPADEPLELTDDFTEYRLHLPIHWRQLGEIALASGGGTPLAIWVDASLVALEPCWSAKQPPFRLHDGRKGAFS